MHTVPEAIAERLRQIGTGFDLPAVQALYAPLLARQPRDGVTLHADQRYGAHARHRLDVYVPEALQGRLPVLVAFHGGGFIRGDKSQRANIGWHFARQGIVTVLPNYRLAPESQWPSGPQDVAAVLRWLREHLPRFGGDADRIVLMGESAGAAHVAAATLMRGFRPDDTTEDRIAGAVLLSGPYNARLEGLARAQFGVPTPDPRNEAYFGADPAAWDAASIVDHINAAPFPLAIGFAERDLLPMQVQAGELFARLVSRHGFTPQLWMLREHNHFSQGFSIGTQDTSLSDRLLAFVREHAGT